MRQFVLFNALCLLILFSCKSNNNGPDPATPVDYNAKVESLENELEEPILKTEAEIKVRGDKADFAGMARSAKAIEDSIDIRINALKKINPVGKGGDDFKTMSVRYFEYLKSIYTAYENIATAKSDEARNDAAGKMADILKAQAGVLTNLKMAQQKYAADNGFTIE